jgi:hypothetical protein
MISETSLLSWRSCVPALSTFPGEVLLDLAADAIDLSGATQQSPLEFEGIRDRCLPEAVAHTKAQHHKSGYALRAAAMLHGGVDPALLDEVQSWRSDDLWYWSLEALATYVRARATAYLEKNSDSMIATVTRTALAAPELIKHRVLTILSGVGVPMASALLTIWNPDEFTVIDVRAISTWRAAGHLRSGNDWPPYLEYVDLCRRLAADSAPDLRSLDRALWQWSASDGVLKLSR